MTGIACIICLSFIVYVQTRTRMVYQRLPELFNCYHNPAYTEVVATITKKLDDEMAEISDEPVHNYG